MPTSDRRAVLFVIADFLLDRRQGIDGVLYSISSDRFRLWSYDSGRIELCTIIDHSRSGVVYNFGRVCMYVCLSDDNFRSLDVVSSCLHMRVCLRVEFVYEGHRVKVKVPGAENVENSYSRNVKTRLAITPVRLNIEPWCLRAAWVFLGTAERMM